VTDFQLLAFAILPLAVVAAVLAVVWLVTHDKP
jgi:hypothetical protein